MTDPQVKALSQVLAPYRTLRLWIYGLAGASGVIGGMIFGMQALAGKDVGLALPNLGIQVGVISLCALLWRWEKKRQRQQEERIAQKLAQKLAHKRASQAHL